MNMDIWIRSQNREKLVKINQIYFYQFDKEAGLGDDYHIFANELEVGIYKSKERALEIIGEIQEKIEKMGEFEYEDSENYISKRLIHYGKVYKMPKE